MGEKWSNFNSTLSITRSIFDKTPLPYVPETASEYELKREIILYNFRSYLTWSSLAGIFGGAKGGGWYMLPEGWYYKPKELWEMSKIGVKILVNLVFAMLPLSISEPLMIMLNPELKKRPRIQNYKLDSYAPHDWDPVAAKDKAYKLKHARDEKKKSGRVTMEIQQPAIAE